MRIEEAYYIRDAVIELGLPRGSICLNIGSSTTKFRGGSHAMQHSIVFDELDRLGLKTFHCDLKEGHGVDFPGDIFDTTYRASLRACGASLLLCNNILEHVRRPSEFASCCAEVVAPGGYAIVSIPRSYPYHPDPIDTMLRLSPAEVSDYFMGWEVVKDSEIKSTRFWDDLVKGSSGAYRVLRHFGLLMMPFYRSESYLSRLHRTLWLFKPYLQTVVVLRRL